MDDKKDFKMIVLRGLDEDERTLSIIQRTMKDHDIKTGQKVIVKIIERYDSLEKQNDNLKQLIREREKQIRDLENKLHVRTQVLQNLKSVFKFVETL